MLRDHILLFGKLVISKITCTMNSLAYLLCSKSATLAGLKLHLPAPLWFEVVFAGWSHDLLQTWSLSSTKKKKERENGIKCDRKFFCNIFLFEYKADNTILNTIYDTILTALLLIRVNQYYWLCYLLYY